MDIIRQNSLVSVIVPVYNIELYLRKCIDSILNQSYSNIELILVDDGSTDSSGRICDEYGSIDERVQVIHQINGGVSLARYNGVQQAKGEWCFFVDGDDCIPQKALEMLLAHSRNYDIINGQYRGCDVQGNIISSSNYSKYEIGVCTNVDFVRNILLDRRNGALWRQLIKTTILKESIVLLPREIKVAEDWLLSIKIGLHINSSFGIPDVVYIYNDNPNSVTHIVQRKLKDIELVDYYLEQFVEDDIRFSEALFRCRLRHLKSCITERNTLSSKFVAYIHENAAKYKLNFPESYLLCLSYIHNRNLRVFLWKAYTIPQRIRNKIIYYIHLLNR